MRVLSVSETWTGGDFTWTLLNLIGTWEEGVTVHFTGTLERSLNKCRETFLISAVPRVLRLPESMTRV